MKLKSIRIENFRNHEDTYIEFDRTNIISGTNGAGKSSLRAAIEYALTGRCMWTDQRGQGATDLIRNGAEEAKVTLELWPSPEYKDPIKVARSIPHKLQVGELKGSITVQQTLLDGMLKVSSAAISAALNITDIIKMPPTKQQEILVSLLGEEITPNKVRAALIEEMGDKAATWIDQVVPKDTPGQPPSATGIAVIDQAEKAARELRKDEKKRLQVLETVTKVNEVDLRVDPADMARIEGILADTRKNRDELTEALGAAKTRRSQAASDQARKTRLENERMELEALVRGSLPLTPEAVAEYRVATEAANDELARSRADRLQAKQLHEAECNEVRTYGAEAEALRKTIAALEEFNGACPVAPEHVKCGHSAGVFLKTLEALKAELNTAELATVDRLNKANETEANIKALEATIKLAEEVLGNRSQRLAAMEKALVRIPDIEAELATITTPDTEADTEAIEAGIAQANADIEKLDKDLKAMQVAVIAKEKEAESKMAIKEAKANISTLDTLVDLLATNLRSKMVAKRLEKVMFQASEALQSLTGGAYSLLGASSDRFHLTVMEAATGAARNPVLMSTSEQARVALAFQAMVLELTNLGIAVLDDAEDLDPKNKSRVLGFLHRSDRIQTAIILATASDNNPPKASTIPDITVFTAEGGKVTKA